MRGMQCWSLASYFQSCLCSTVSGEQLDRLQRKIQTLSHELLLCSETGQVMTSVDSNAAMRFVLGLSWELACPALEAALAPITLANVP